jgi:hypothetical protein
MTMARSEGEVGTMTQIATPDRVHTGLIEDDPERGEIIVEDVVISEVEHWVEDGLHVFRSTEFDLIAEHEAEFGAVVVFLESAEDLLLHLSDLILEKKATDHEVETAALLLRRFMRMAQASEREREEVDRKLFHVPRVHRHRPRRAWRRIQSTPKNSSPASPA